jgi:chromosome segregation ATPase
MTHSPEFSEDTTTELKETLRKLDQRFTDLELNADNERTRRQEAEQKLAGLEEQLARLEQELGQEKERAENLNELANERREEVVRVTEKFEEAQERYEDTEWRLGKAKHFERLVHRRRALIASLIGTIRAKQKANSALKAGIDGLRKFKAAAEGKQQKLLGKIERLEAGLHEAEERIAQFDDPKVSNEELEKSSLEIRRLRDDLQSREETIDQLHEELKHARISQNESAVKASEIERLRDKVSTKNAAIAELQTSADELERARAKLREREDEILRLMSSAEADRQTIEQLNQKMQDLAPVSPQSNESESSRDPEDAAKLEEQEETIARLSDTIKEYENTIATLSEAVDHWKRKYDFLAADTPYDYDSKKWGE